MSDLDSFIRDQFIPFRQRLIKEFEEKHPHLFSLINMTLSGKQIKAGLQVLENGQVAGNYTIYATGAAITGVDSGKLESEITLPIVGIIKPYAVIERSVLQKAMDDERQFISDPISTAKKYMPDITVKFLR